MEPLFINRHIRDEAVYKEVYRSHFFSPFMILPLSRAALTYISSLVLAIMGQDILYENLIIVPVALGVIFLSYRLRLSTAIKRDKEQFGQPPTIICEVSQTGIRIGADGHFSQEVPFSGFRRAKETKHLILLFSRARLVYIFHKDGFVKGSVPEFNRFLWENNLRIR